MGTGGGWSGGAPVGGPGEPVLRGQVVGSLALMVPLCMGLLTIVVRFNAQGAESGAAAPTCLPEMRSLRYPVLALEKMISGTVDITFVVGARGAIERVRASGDPLLRMEAEAGFRGHGLSPLCRGRQVTIRLTYRIDPDLPLTLPASTTRFSPIEYSIVSPAVVAVVLADPPVEFHRDFGQYITHLLRKLTFWNRSRGSP